MTIVVSCIVIFIIMWAFFLFNKFNEAQKIKDDKRREEEMRGHLDLILSVLKNRKEEKKRKVER